MNIQIILGIIIVHFIADFIFQTEKQAKEKSSNFLQLLHHSFTYTTIWAIAGIFYVLFNIKSYDNWDLSLFLLITFVFHTLTDYYTSRLNKKLLPASYNMILKINVNEKPKTFWHYPQGQNFHNFFVGVGFDQVLHYFQLFITYYLLTK